MEKVAPRMGGRGLKPCELVPVEELSETSLPAWGAWIETVLDLRAKSC